MQSISIDLEKHQIMKMFQHYVLFYTLLDSYHEKYVK